MGHAGNVVPCCAALTAGACFSRLMVLSLCLCKIECGSTQQYPVTQRTLGAPSPIRAPPDPRAPASDARAFHPTLGPLPSGSSCRASESPKFCLSVRDGALA